MKTKQTNKYFNKSLKWKKKTRKQVNTKFKKIVKQLPDYQAFSYFQ